MSDDANLEKGNVYWLPAESTDNISKHTLEHPVAFVREAIGGIWHGALRTSKKSRKKGGSIPSPPIPELNLNEGDKHWNVDPYANIVNPDICRYIGILPDDQKDKVIKLYDEFILSSKIQSSGMQSFSQRKRKKPR